MFPPTVKTVKIWSDGPTSQFKNKFIAAVIWFFEQKFQIKIFWNFFTAAHGKSCIDGIGAAVEKQVKTMVLSKERTVYQTSDFVSAFQSKESKVELLNMTPEEIESINVELNLNDLFLKAQAIPGI